MRSAQHLNTKAHCDPLLTSQQHSLSPLPTPASQGASPWAALPPPKPLTLSPHLDFPFQGPLPAENSQALTQALVFADSGNAADALQEHHLEHLLLVTTERQGESVSWQSCIPRIIELLRLERTSKIIKSNRILTTVPQL